MREGGGGLSHTSIYTSHSSNIYKSLESTTLTLQTEPFDKITHYEEKPYVEEC